ncbi:hypothetical protein HAX54_039130, partial [Datura stramonium]|nr:hypothetical protein [Datura stramonium]
SALPRGPRMNNEERVIRVTVLEYQTLSLRPALLRASYNFLYATGVAKDTWGNVDWG